MKIVLVNEQITEELAQTALDKLSDFMNSCFNASGNKVKLKVPLVRMRDRPESYMITASVEIVEKANYVEPEEV